MKVSAIIPAFNRRAYLPRAIDSALAQTVPVDEILVVDDGSTDGSADFCSRATEIAFVSSGKRIPAYLAHAGAGSRKPGGVDRVSR